MSVGVYVPESYGTSRSQAGTTIESQGKLRAIQNEIRAWDQAVLGFREDHQFLVSAGPISGEWQVDRLGNVRDETYTSSGFFSKFQYSFHLPIIGGFGYFLGTSLGYLFEDQNNDDFQAASAFMLPGVLVGLTHNFSPGLRVLAGVEYYLERWDDLGERVGNPDDPEEADATISVTARAFDAHIAADFFYELKWAVRLEAHRRQVTFASPRDASGKDVDATVGRSDNWLGLGLLYHLM